jgi:hypothetical protein
MSFWALYWPTLFAIKQEKSTLSDKNISSDWESKDLHSNFCVYLTRSRIAYILWEIVLQTSYILDKTFLPFVLAQSALRVVILGIVYSLDFPKSFPGPSMARFTSSVERTFVTCSAPNITGGFFRHCLHWRPKRLHYRSLSKESNNNIIFSGFLLNKCVLLKQTE